MVVGHVCPCTTMDNGSLHNVDKGLRRPDQTKSACLHPAWVCAPGRAAEIRNESGEIKTFCGSNALTEIFRYLDNFNWVRVLVSISGLILVTSVLNLDNHVERG